jgi:hypothetical protein
MPFPIDEKPQVQVVNDALVNTTTGYVNHVEAEDVSLADASIDQIWHEVDKRTAEGRLHGSPNIGSSEFLTDYTDNDAGVTVAEANPSHE